jgi:hypothetical protein
MRAAVLLLLLLSGSSAWAKMSGIDGDFGAAVFFWQRPPAPPTTTKLLASPPAEDVASFAARVSWTYRFGDWGIGDDFDFNPLAMVGWRADGGWMPRFVGGRVRPWVGLAGAAGMFFDTEFPKEFTVKPLAYVSATAGMRVRVGSVMTLGAAVERTIVSTREMWVGYVGIGIGFDQGL